MAQKQVNQKERKCKAMILPQGQRYVWFCVKITPFPSKQRNLADIYSFHWKSVSETVTDWREHTVKFMNSS